MAAPLRSSYSPKNRADWRAWLRKHHAKKSEVWVVLYKKHSPKMNMAYVDALEEAICFGWIDSRVKKIDADRYGIRFIHRQPDSHWSTLNQRLARKMIRSKKMTPLGLAVFQKRKSYPRSDIAVLVKQKRVAMPTGLRAALNRNRKAKKHFASYPPSFRKLAISWVNSAKQPQTRKRRIQNVVRNAAQHAKANY